MNFGTTQLEDDLMAIIDFCHEMGTSIRADWSDPRNECRAIWDAHDIAHVLTGGDARDDAWRDAHLALKHRPDDDENLSEAWPDVKRRMVDVIQRAEEKANG